ncbi:MAG TPA: VWA domain-containing protein [Pyrinomonadaceae bacterium]|jgi:VWFA-related protein
MTRFIILTTFSILFSIAAFAQNPTPAGVKDETDVVKISTTLIQVDVSVTDKNGRQITGLKPEDFEILENGKPQPITNFSYVSSASQTVENSVQPTAKTNPKDKVSVPVPSAALRPEQVRRTIALVVDDLNMSFRAVDSVKTALRKFVDEQMQPGDLVSVIRTSTGSGVFQRFTSDKQILYAAISRIRWYAGGRGNVDVFRQADPDDNGAQYDKFRQDMVIVGTFGVMRYAVRGMSEMPGRKAIVLFSEGFNMFNTAVQEDGSGDGKNVAINSGMNARLAAPLQSLIEAANRASVVIYGIDARGVVAVLPDSADSSFGADSSGKFGMGRGVSSTAIRNERTRELFESQRGLQYISEQTGGFAILNNNNLSKGVERAVNDQNGYYLIGYEPDEQTFDSKTSRYNRLEVKLKNADYRVRYRSGFFGIEDKTLKSPTQTANQQILNALTSPFKSSDINLNLNTVLIGDSNNEALIRSIINIDAKDLSFTRTTDGKRKMNIDIVAVTVGDAGAAVEQFAKNYTITVSEEKYQNILQNGLVYDLPVPVKKIGTYQFRIAVRDSESGKIGSASNLILVPDLAKDFALSGIVLDNTSPQKSPANSNNDSNQSDVYLNMSLRKFKSRTTLRYGYLIYNPKLDSKQKPQIEVQVKLFSQGKSVFETKPAPLNLNGQTDMQHIENVDSIALGSNLPIGEYILQILVTDNLAKGKNRTVSQWIDFEVTN